MLKPQPKTDWPASWHDAYNFDLKEVFDLDASPRGHGNAYRRRMARTLSIIGDVAPAGARIIDVAAAQGNLSLLLAERGYDVTWNDLRVDLAGYVQLKYESGALSFLPGDAFALENVAPYDAIVINEIIEHVAHPDRFLAQIATLLKPGGFVVMTTPNGEYLGNRLPRFSDCPDPSVFEAMQFQPDGDGHIFLLHRDEIAPLAQGASLDVRSIDLFTTFLSAGRLRTEPLLKLLPASMLERIERSSTRWPDAIARRVLVQMAVCLQKPSDTPSDIPISEAT
jgi:2-polyprenyl-6-hydroxyphenyl methylase/3-demethylubiquinone-9 3-methyltransferase